MKETSKKPLSDLRKQRNADLLRRMRSGEPLTSFDSRASWFPPRPIIKKDAREIERLYHGSSAQNSDQQTASGSENVLALYTRGSHGQAS